MRAVDSVVPLDRDARLYGRKITAAYKQAVEGILEAGALLLQAKAELPHGEFERMVAKSCPFGVRTAQRLMQIAAHPVLAKATHVSCLPASWGTLAELAKLEPAELSHAIGNHWVKPEMTREDVAPLRRRVRSALGAGRKEPARRIPGPTPEQAVRRIAKALATKIDAKFGEDSESLEILSDSTTTAALVNVMMEALGREIAAKKESKGRRRNASQPDRWKPLAKLAANGHASGQIAKQIGVTEPTVRAKAKALGIDIPADRVLNKSRRMNHNRVLTEFVNTLESLIPSIELIDLERIDRDVLAESVGVMEEAMKALTKFRRRLRGGADAAVPALEGAA